MAPPRSELLNWPSTRQPPPRRRSRASSCGASSRGHRGVALHVERAVVAILRTGMSVHLPGSTGSREDVAFATYADRYAPARLMLGVYLPDYLVGAAFLDASAAPRPRRRPRHAASASSPPSRPRGSSHQWRYADRTVCQIRVNVRICTINRVRHLRTLMNNWYVFQEEGACQAGGRCVKRALPARVARHDATQLARGAVSGLTEAVRHYETASAPSSPSCSVHLRPRLAFPSTPSGYGVETAGDLYVASRYGSRTPSASCPQPTDRASS